MKISYSTFLIAVIVICFWSCSKYTEENASIHISGKVNNPEGQTVSIISMDPLQEMIELGESNIDSKGIFKLMLEVDEPMEALLIYGRNSAEMWLEPGFNTTISFEGSDFINTLKFNRKGSIENNFLQEISVYNRNYQKDPTGDPERFRSFMNEYRSGAEKLLSTLDRKKGISDLFLRIEKNKVKNRYLSSFHQFVKNYNYQNGAGFELMEDEKDLWNQFDLQNSELLISKNHRKTVHEYISSLTYDSARNDPSGSRDNGKKKAMKYFLSRDIHPDFKQYVIASNISDDLEYPGFKYAKPKYDTFLIQYPESRFIKPLQNKFSKWEELTMGNPAPNFSGLSPDGKSISLDDFKGNVVYVDIWASWCKPCYQEFPYSMELKKEFSEDEVVFMYVSIDDDSSYWKKGLEKLPELEGIHMIVDGAWQSDFAEKYIVRSIPRYMLFDKEGIIVDVEANRPSSGKQLARDILSLL